MCFVSASSTNAVTTTTSGQKLAVHYPSVKCEGRRHLHVDMAEHHGPPQPLDKHTWAGMNLHRVSRACLDSQIQPRAKPCQSFQAEASGQSLYCTAREHATIAILEVFEGATLQWRLLSIVCAVRTVEPSRWAISTAYCCPVAFDAAVRPTDHCGATLATLSVRSPVL